MKTFAISAFLIFQTNYINRRIKIMNIEMNMLKTLLLAVVLLIIGKQIRSKFQIFVKYCIPSAVIGGLLFSFITLILYKTGTANFTFDKTLQTFFMNIFFAASGCGAGLGLLKKGGKQVGIFVVLAAVLAFLQNVVAVGVGKVVGVTPLIALMTGSIPMTGGHGNAASFAPIAEGFGAQGAVSVAVAAATFGLVAGSIMGGPIGNRIITKHGFDKNLGAAMNSTTETTKIKKIERPFLDKERTTLAIFLVFISLGVGSYLFDIFKVILPNVVLPIHVMCMMAGVIVRNVYDAIKKPTDQAIYEEIDNIGDISLGLFVSMAIMTMKLWELAELALPLIILLFAQCVLVYIFATQITFRAMGSDYDAAVMAVGHVGFSTGAVPVSMTTMKTVCDKYAFSRVAFFVVPLVGGLFSNFTNAAIITAFLNFFK